MRGKVKKSTGMQKSKGITPAYAGKRKELTNVRNNFRDHPRICGEKLPPPALKPLFLGSPPHMRGKGLEDDFEICKKRITPAYAVKSYHVLYGVLIRWDHPRICGEKTKKIP